MRVKQLIKREIVYYSGFFTSSNYAVILYSLFTPTSLCKGYNMSTFGNIVMFIKK